MREFLVKTTCPTSNILAFHRKGRSLCLLLGAVAASAQAQSVLFDFASAPVHAPLPINLTVGAVTAYLSYFSAYNYGFSIQPSDVLGFTPAGFAGNVIYPSSIYPADLLVSFNVLLSDFSIMFAPEEYGCDTSATMRVTGYLDANYVATNTASAPFPGTWPTGTLTLTAPQGFNDVVIHYAAAPACTDYGPIFMADQMYVTPIDTIFANGFE
jgi:hypothetical protein